MFFLFIKKILRLNNLKARAAMNAKNSVFVICAYLCWSDQIICMSVPLSYSVPFTYRCITNNHTSLHLRWKENLHNYQKVSKYYEYDCSIIMWNAVIIYYLLFLKYTFYRVVLGMSVAYLLLTTVLIRSILEFFFSRRKL